MLIQRIAVKDFLIFQDVDVEFPESGLISIVGTYAADAARSNGSGKTALLEAIRYALYGRCRSKGDVVRKGHTQATIDLQVSINEQQIRVRRIKSSKGASRASIWIDGEKQTATLRQVDDLIKDIIGIDAELFDLVYFFKQNDQFGFLRAGPAARKESLTTVFRMESVLKCLDVAKTKFNECTTNVQRIEGAIVQAIEEKNALPSIEDIDEWMLEAEDRHSVLLMREEALRESRLRYIELLEELEDHRTEFEASTREKIVKRDAQKSRIVDLERAIASVSEKVQVQRSFRAQAEAESDEADNRIQALKVQVIDNDDTTQIVEDIKDIDASILSTNREKERLNKLVSTVGSLTAGKCPTCNHFITPDYVDTLSTKIPALLSNQDEIIATLDKRKRVYERELIDLQSSQKARNEQDTCRAKIARLETDCNRADKNISELNKEHIALETEAGELRASHSSLVRDLADADNVRGIFDRYSKALELMRSEAEQELHRELEPKDDIVAEIARLDALGDRHTEAEHGIAELKQKLKTAVKKVGIARYVRDAFGKNGIQAIMIENFVGAIEAYTNAILKDLDTKYSISLVTQTYTKSGDVKETLDVLVNDGAISRLFETYSGGEQTLINLALRIALSKIIGGLHDVDMKCLFLDEILAALDSVNRQEVVKLVGYLTETFNQVFIISHTSEVGDMVTKRLTVKRFENHSTVMTDA